MDGREVRISVTRTKLRDDLVLEKWQQIDAQSLGAIELQTIRLELVKEVGERATPSPAALARILADRGVCLRPAEVLAADTTWRKRKLNELFAAGELEFGSIQSSVESLERIDDLLIHFDSEADEGGRTALRELVIELKEELLSISIARIQLGREQAIAAEVVEWLTVWLQTPHIFSDWLELRRSSEEFRQKFWDTENIGPIRPL